MVVHSDIAGNHRGSALSPKHCHVASKWALKHDAAVLVLGCCDPIEVGCNRQWDRAKLDYDHGRRSRSTERVVEGGPLADNGCAAGEGATSSCATGREGVAAAFGTSHRYMYPNAVALPLDLDSPSIRLSVVTRSICSVSSHMTLLSSRTALLDSRLHGPGLHPQAHWALPRCGGRNSGERSGTRRGSSQSRIFRRVQLGEWSATAGQIGRGKTNGKV